MRIQKWTWAAWALVVGLGLSIAVNTSPAAQDKPLRERIDLSKLGPKVGERVPDFNLKDQTGTQRTLESVLGPKGALLVFYRSADW